MQFETFRGKNVEEALAAVRAALGPDALIESTRHVSNGGHGWLGRSFVEVVAAPGQGHKGLREPVGRELAPSRPRLPAALRLGSLAATVEGRIASTIAERAGAPEINVRVAGRAAMDQELRVIRALLEELTYSRKPRDRALSVLAAAGIEGALASALAAGAMRATHDPLALRRFLRKRLAERLRVLPSPITQSGARLIVCVGPTGVGKTTTLAKLAAQAQLDVGRSVAVVTLDTFRVGAVEQMRRWIELVGVPFDVARDRSSFAQVVTSRKADVVLVDTAGISNPESASMRRIAECLQTVTDRAVEILLVVPASIRQCDVERMRAVYADPAPTGLVVTKLDETAQIGGAVHAAAEEGLPLAYFCDGPRVPEDIHDASVDALLDFAMPESR